MKSTISPGSSSTAESTGQAVCQLSVVIVNWNVKDMLRDCLQSLEADGVSAWAEVIVVDNASADHSAEMVAEEFPWVKLIDSKKNLGFSRGNNLAIPQATGELVLLLNPDTIVHPGAMRKLVDFASQNPKYGIVGAKQYARDGSIHFEGAVGFPTAWNVFCDLTLLSKFFSRSRLFCGRKMGYWDHEDDREVPAVPGAVMLVRREVFQKIGLLDENMFYVEDMDFCYRTQRAGWRIFYLGSASIVHYGGGSTSSGEKAAIYRQIAFQSLWLYMRKNRGPFATAGLTTMVFSWAATTASFLWIAKLVFRASSLREPLARFYALAVGLLRWSLLDKEKFSHHLATPLQTES